MLDWSTYRRATADRVFDCCGLLFLLGLIILITYYNATEEPGTGFEAFMDDQDFGVRVLFTAFGVLLTFSRTSTILVSLTSLSFFFLSPLFLPFCLLPLSHPHQSITSLASFVPPTRRPGVRQAANHQKV